jgi:hypothetical protein
MSGTGMRTGRKWLLALLVTLALIFGALVLANRGSKHPRIDVAFEATAADGKQSLFTITNASPLIVHLVAHQIGDSFTPRQAESISPGQSITVSVPLPGRPVPNQSASANTNSPPRAAAASIRFHFRRQDTALEEAREMLDSVLSSIGLRIRGLNPDSSENEFQVDYRLPPAPLPNL